MIVLLFGHITTSLSLMILVLSHTYTKKSNPLCNRFMSLLPSNSPTPISNPMLHIPGYSHIGKAVDHTDEQVLLLGIGEELHIPLATVVADHGEAGDLIFAAVIVNHPGEAPVHLKGLSGLCSEPLPPASLGRHQLPPGGYQEAVDGDIVLDRGQSTGIPRLLEPLQAYLSVGNALDEELVQDGRVSGEYRLSGLTALQTVGLESEAVLLSLRSFALETPVRRYSSARLILSREKFFPCSCFISSMACAIISCKPLLFSSFMLLLSLGCWHFPV